MYICIYWYWSTAYRIPVLDLFGLEIVSHVDDVDMM